MGTLIYCDGFDCKKTDHSCNEIIYTIMENAKQFLDGANHLCKFCFDEYKEGLDIEFEIIDEFIYAKRSK